MALAATYEDVKGNQRRNVGKPENGVVGSSLVTEFFSGKNGLPHGVMSAQAPGRITYPHYHSVDQFQVLIKGGGRMGRHDLTTYSVHFSKAYTPYGPFSTDKETGLVFFNLHARTDPHFHAMHLPQEAETLNRVPNRRPWQITTRAEFAEDGAENCSLREIPGLRDENGLGGCAMSMKANAQADAPDPSKGEGQFLVIPEGSIIHEGRELPSPALVFVGPREPRYRIQAGPAGAKVIILNFPVADSGRKHVASSQALDASAHKVMGCNLCSFVYEEAMGLPDEGIAPGTRWQDVPETWTCPDCGATKADFQAVDI